MQSGSTGRCHGRMETRAGQWISGVGVGSRSDGGAGKVWNTVEFGRKRGAPNYEVRKNLYLGSRHYRR